LVREADLSDELRRRGLAAGLDHLAFCAAEPFDSVRMLIEERNASGLSAGMQFTFRNPKRSTDPSRAVAGARSLAVGCLAYRRAEPESSVPSHRRGSVARYAWHNYYALLEKALSEVAACLVEHGWRARVLVDDNGLVDRAAAHRAGLGWYGKNCNILLPGEGSMFVLGSVVTDAPLRAGTSLAVRDGCGACHRCVDDCPTGALIAPGVLDARRCLAWLLQSPGVFPLEYREALGDRIYGCDDCQSGCPVNVIGERRNPARPAEADARPTIDVTDLIEASDSQIEQSVGRWYIPRREMRYVRRNALVVLGNVGDGSDPRAAAALAGALRSGDPIERAHAVWAARRLGRVDLIETSGLLARETDPMVISELEAVVVARDRRRAPDGCGFVTTPLDAPA
jgi:epoxyqueuosine reductase